MPDAERPWTLERSGASDNAGHDYPNWQPAEEMLAHFASQSSDVPPDAPHSGAPRWLDSIRSIEVAEAIDRSLRRGRAVELKVDETNEASNFKGTMASLGCGLLMFGMFVLFMVGMANSVKELVQWPAQLVAEWPKLLLGLLGLFLAMQFLLGIVRPGNRPDGG